MTRNHNPKFSSWNLMPTSLGSKSAAAENPELVDRDDEILF